MPVRLFPLVLVLAACGDKDTPYVPPTDDTADAEVPNIVVNVRAYDFGTVDDVGDTAQTQITVQNTGLGVLNVALAVSEGAPFTVSSAALVINPQSASQVTVYFKPTDYAAVAGTLTLASDDVDEPEVEVALSGDVLLDADGDGYVRPEAGGDDCDDEREDVNPGASESYYDGVDQNCDGLSDYDQDLDGYITETKEPDVADGGGDCNDVNASIYPGAADSWYDGVDSNCDDANDYDQDGDGYASKAYGKGKDCDDFDDAAYPGSAERLNGKLDDCDGDLDQDALVSTADYIWYGEKSSETAGYSLGAGDVDGDGTEDIFIGARAADSGRGEVYLLLSGSGWPASGSNLSKASASVAGASSSEGLGSAIAFVADYEGDGVQDVAMGAYNSAGTYGALYLLDADKLATGSATLSDAHTTIKGTSGSYYVGRSAASGDMDGDGMSDVLFDYTPSTGSNRSYIGLQYGGTTGSISISSVGARWTTENDQSAAYETLSDPQDLNGDGYDDFVFGDLNADGSYTNSGKVWVLWGLSLRYTASGSASLGNSAETLVVGEASNEKVGYVAGALPDMDGDGLGELFYWNYTDGDLGVHYGDSALKGGGSINFSESDLIIDFASSLKASVVRANSDWDGDGWNDLFVGIDASGSSTPGRIYLFEGGSTGSIDDDDELGDVKGDSDTGNTYFSHAVSAVSPDADGNGARDLLSADYGFSGDVNGDGTNETNIGAVYLFLAQ